MRPGMCPYVGGCVTNGGVMPSRVAACDLPLQAHQDGARIQESCQSAGRISSSSAVLRLAERVR